MTPTELKVMPRYAIIRALLSGTIPSSEIMAAFDIRTSISYLGPGCYGITYRCKKGHYHIVVSDELSPEAQVEVLFHELKHVIEDMAEAGCLVTVDKQYETRERQADLMFREVASAMGK